MKIDPEEIPLDLKSILKLQKYLPPDFYIKQFQLNVLGIKEAEKEALPYVFECLTYYQCQRCGNCCKTCSVQLSENESLLLAKHNKDKFFSILDENIIAWNELKAPCGYYQDKVCEVREIRPQTCKTYPISFCYMGLITIQKCPMGTKLIDDISKFFTLERTKFKKGMKSSDKQLSSQQQTEEFMFKIAKDFSNLLSDLGGRSSKVTQIMPELSISFIGFIEFTKHLRKTNKNINSPHQPVSK